MTEIFSLYNTHVLALIIYFCLSHSGVHDMLYSQHYLIEYEHFKTPIRIFFSYPLYHLFSNLDYDSVWLNWSLPISLLLALALKFSGAAAAAGEIVGMRLLMHRLNVDILLAATVMV